MTWPWGNSSDVESDNTSGNEGSGNDDDNTSDSCGLNQDNSDEEGDEDGDDDAIANLNISMALQVSINMTLNRSCKAFYYMSLKDGQLTGTNSDYRNPDICFEWNLRAINLFLHWYLRLWQLVYRRFSPRKFPWRKLYSS